MKSKQLIKMSVIGIIPGILVMSNTGYQAMAATNAQLASVSSQTSSETSSSSSDSSSSSSSANSTSLRSSATSSSSQASSETSSSSSDSSSSFSSANSVSLRSSATSSSSQPASTSSKAATVKKDTDKTALTKADTTSDDTTALPAVSLKTNFNKTLGQGQLGNLATMNLSIATTVTQNIKTGDKIVVSLSNEGIDYSTLTLTDGSSYFTVAPDAASSTITLTATKDITYAGTITAGLTATAAKSTSNTNQAATYALTSKYQRDTASADATINYATLTVNNVTAPYTDSFGPHLVGSTSPQVSSVAGYHNNFLGNSSTQVLYNYDQEGMLIVANLNNYTRGLTATNITWNVAMADFATTDPSLNYVAPKDISKASLRIYKGTTDMTSDLQDAITWDSNGLGFSIKLPGDYVGYDSNQWSCLFVVETNGDETRVNGTSSVTATDKDTGEAIVEDKTHSIYVGATKMFRYSPTTAGKFIPYITAEDKTVYDTDKISKADLLALATASDQNDGDLSNQVTITDYDGYDVDNPQVGSYKLTYSVTNNSGSTSTTTATLTVVANQTDVKAKDVTIYKGTTWTAADSFDGATDKDGNPISLSDVTVTDADKVDTDTPGTYKVTYTYAGKTAISTITVKDRKTAVKVHDTTIQQGADWTAANNFDSATDKDGNDVDLSDVTVTGTVKTDTPGNYPIKYTYDGVTATATVTVKASQVSVTAHDSMVTQNEPWTAADSFEGATDENGNDIDFSEVTVTDDDKVDTSKIGSYEVTYSYKDKYDNPASAVITVKVVASQVAVNAKTSTIVKGAKWTAKDNFTSATDADGKQLDFADVTVTGADKVDTSKVGNYDVTYSYTDKYGNPASATVTITVVASQVAVNAKTSTIVKGAKWTAKDNFTSATDADGKQLDFAAVTVTDADKVDTSKVGNYDVTYSYTDDYGNPASKTVTVEVVDSKVAVDAKASTVMQGSIWNAKDNFVGATDATGKAGTFADVKVTGNVDTSKAGDYPVTYTYKDVYGNEDTQTITVTVEASQVAIDAKDSTLMQGETWKANDNFVSAADENGDTIDFAHVKVTGKVDTSKAGRYSVTYSYTDKYGNPATKIVTVTVEASQVAIEANNSTLTKGSKWNAKDNFVRAADADGKTVDFTDVKVTADVNTSKIGSYQVTYQYTDQYGNVAKSTVTIKVTASRATLKTKNITVIAGPKSAWQASDSFISGTDMKGQALTFADVKVIDADAVDVKTPGTYQVTYQYTDTNNNLVTSVATITVKASQESVVVKNSTLTVGDKWRDSDNWVTGTDASGQAIKFSDLRLTGTVDTSKVGNNFVSYSYTDAVGNVITKTAIVKVQASVVTDNNQNSNTAKENNNATNENNKVDDQEMHSAADQVQTDTNLAVTDKSAIAQDNSGTKRVAKNDKQLTPAYRLKAPTTTDNNAELPQTNEKSQAILPVWGMLLLMVTGSLAVLGIKRRRTNK